MPVEFSFSKRAYRDIAEIVAYIAEDNEGAARGIYETIMDTIEMLSAFPKAGRSRNELGRQLRSFPLGNYVIYYRVTSSRGEIVRILGGAMDVMAIFKKQIRSDR